jgi:NADH:ubiquinone oxidoreductase subunit 5 (subunit L)/multisubunit Na+/H+ antiporter MnhA subunit
MLESLAPPALVLALVATGLAAALPRAGSRLLGVAAALAAVPAVAAIAGTTITLPGIEVDAFGGLVLLLVFGIGATVVAYAERNLRHEPYQQRFVRIAALLLPASATVALADELALLGAAWVATSWITVALIRTGPAAGIEARSLRVRRSFAAGDLCFVAAMALLSAEVGPTWLAGLLVVVAAASRSAAGPFLRWLPDSLGAPTPASALLHAGVVNGGAIVLIGLAPVTTEIAVVAAAAVLIGGLTCIFAEAVMLTRPDVKGQLAWSTIAQMSFTLLLCGAGLHVAAALHLVAHGFYKGALFLGSGSTVRGMVRRRVAPPASRSIGRATSLGAFAAMGIVVLATAAAAGATFTGDAAVPLGLAWVAAGCATAAALHRARGAGQVTGALALGGAAVALHAVVALALKDVVAPGLALDDAALPAAVVLPVLAALAAVAATRDHRGAPESLLARAWRIARAAGRPTAAPRLHVPGPLAWRPDAPAPIHQPALQHGA